MAKEKGSLAESQEDLLVLLRGTVEDDVHAKPVVHMKSLLE